MNVLGWIILGVVAVAVLKGFEILLPAWFLDLLNSWYPDVIFHKKYHVVDKVVALSIDDGPKDPLLNKRFIQVLEKHGASATFFILANNVEKYDPKREYLVDLINAGHTLGNHGRANFPAVLSWFLKRDIMDTEKIIGNAYESSDFPRPGVKLYRPSHALFNQNIIDTAKDCGYATVLGNNYPNDPFIKVSTLNARYILSRVEPGDIIVLHHLSHTIETLDIVLPELKRRGYSVVTIEEMLK